MGRGSGGGRSRSENLQAINDRRKKRGRLQDVSIQYCFPKQSIGNCSSSVCIANAPHSHPPLYRFTSITFTEFSRVGRFVYLFRKCLSTKVTEATTRAGVRPGDRPSHINSSIGKNHRSIVRIALLIAIRFDSAPRIAVIVRGLARARRGRE